MFYALVIADKTILQKPLNFLWTQGKSIISRKLKAKGPLPKSHSGLSPDSMGCSGPRDSLKGPNNLLLNRARDAGVRPRALRDATWKGPTLLHQTKDAHVGVPFLRVPLVFFDFFTEATPHQMGPTAPALSSPCAKLRAAGPPAPRPKRRTMDEQLV